MRLQPAERRGFYADTELELTGAEFSLLLALAQRVGQVVDKAVLTREALGREIERFDRSVDVHLSRLRRKLGDASEQQVRIEAIRGVGYQLVVPGIEERAK
jgi:two-component system response regulator CpxR